MEKNTQRRGWEEVLREKKAKDGRLSKIGEWMLSGKHTGWVLEDCNVRYVMR